MSQCSVSSSSSVPCPLPWSGCSMPTVLWCRAFPNPRPSPGTAPCRSLGPVAVTQSRAQRCPPLPMRSCSRHQAPLSSSALCPAHPGPQRLQCPTSNAALSPVLLSAHHLTLGEQPLAGPMPSSPPEPISAPQAPPRPRGPVPTRAEDAPRPHPPCGAEVPP